LKKKKPVFWGKKRTKKKSNPPFFPPPPPQFRIRLLNFADVTSPCFFFSTQFYRTIFGFVTAQRKAETGIMTTNSAEDR